MPLHLLPFNHLEELRGVHMLLFRHDFKDTGCSTSGELVFLRSQESRDQVLGTLTGKQRVCSGHTKYLDFPLYISSLCGPILAICMEPAWFCTTEPLALHLSLYGGSVQQQITEIFLVIGHPIKHGTTFFVLYGFCMDDGHHCLPLQYYGFILYYGFIIMYIKL